MKKWIFLILFLNINISYGFEPVSVAAFIPIPLGYKHLKDYCHYLDPKADPWVDTVNIPKRAYCYDQQNKELAKLACCVHKNEGYKTRQYFWIKVYSDSEKSCSVGSESRSCKESSGVY